MAETALQGAGLDDAAMLLTAAEVGRQLGISARKVYELAGKPLPCYRIGGSVRFKADDVREYLEQCRYTETKKRVAGALNSTVSLRASAESALESAFRARGIEPKLTPTTSKKRASSTRPPKGQTNLTLVSKKP